MHSTDGTIERKLLTHYKFLFSEYELIKAKKHPKYKFVTELCLAHNINKQGLLKYYGRYKNTEIDSALLPQKRGRKFGQLKYMPFIQNKVEELRDKGFGRYEIFDLMLPKYGRLTPSASTIYNILKRKNKHKLSPNLIRKKRRIVTEEVGQLGHADLHIIKKGVILDTSNNQSRKYYLFGCIDDYTRIAWASICYDATATTSGMECLKVLSVFYQVYNFEFKAMLTDNGSEFGKKDSRDEVKRNHPFERLLIEKNIKHRFTRPYRPQTNGKIERFWRTIETEFIADHTFNTIDEFAEGLYQYLIYYNHIRRHQGIGNITPYEMLESVSE